MKNFHNVVDNAGKTTAIRTSLTGTDLLKQCELNKGSAFTKEERDTFDLHGKLPDHVATIDEQVERCYRQYREEPDNFRKNIYLNNLKKQNSILFYRLVSAHLYEMVPIIYTPTVSEAVKAYKYRTDAPAGLYFSCNNMDHIDEMLAKYSPEDIDIIMVTDGESILGIGDWGIGGMAILEGKLDVYTLYGGINPARTLSIQFDVGTDNEDLLNDPAYLGWHHKRIRGEEYNEFIDRAVSAIRKAFPDIYLHWEDFNKSTAYRNLDKYRDEIATFNDDMQGTGAVTLSCIQAWLGAFNHDITEQRIVILGAGTAAVGIANLMRSQMAKEGLSTDESHRRFWLINSRGLVTENMTNIADFQMPYARPDTEIADWKKR